MTDKFASENPDDAVLIDFALGQCVGDKGRRVQDRLTKDESFARRSKRISGLLGLLDACQADDPSEELIARTAASARSASRTLALIDREAARARTLSFPTFNLKELGAMAAVLILIAAILIPSFRRARELSVEQACLAKVGRIGTAITHYANENKGYLPAAGAQNASWLPVGGNADYVGNSQSLWKLVLYDFADPTDFQCPAGNIRQVAKASGMVDFPEAETISYSYQDTVNAPPLRSDAPQLGGHIERMAILADQTPVFEGGRFRPDCLNKQNSPNHGGRGQVVLYLDMHAEWTTHGRVGVADDNIWTAQGVSEYKGTERPTNEADTFLLPNYVEFP